MGFPDLTRTVQALEAYDAESSSVNAEAVGIAYGHDTSDRNNFEDCKALIRPGKQTPAHPDDLSFVRRMVQKFRDQSKET